MTGIGLESISTGRAFGLGGVCTAFSLSVSLPGWFGFVVFFFFYICICLYTFLLLLTASIRQERRCVA